MKWEYRRVSTSAICHQAVVHMPADGHMPIGLLNDLGDEGWELVESYDPPSAGLYGSYASRSRYYLFKRQVQT